VYCNIVRQLMCFNRLVIRAVRDYYCSMSGRDDANWKSIIS
jgi:hypothetical protein